MTSVQFPPEVLQREDTKKFILRKSSTQSAFDNTEKIRNWINEKSIKGIQERADSALTRTKAVYDPILYRETTLVKDIDNYLSHRRLTGLRKKEILHKKWNDRVYEPIAHQIEGVMNGPFYDDMRSVRMEEMQNYLDHRNRLGHVFLETFDPEQYDPLRVLEFDRSYDKNKVKFFYDLDPLVSQQTFRRHEDQTILRCDTGRTESASQYLTRTAPKLPFVPKGRHGIASREWIKFEEGDIDSKLRFESRDVNKFYEDVYRSGKRMRGYMLSGEFDHRNWYGHKEDTMTSSQWQSEKTAQFDKQLTSLSIAE